MEFPASYFQGEYREGFYVAPMMKRAWAAQMEVLLLFDEICDTYGLRWYIAYGTLLGAVRHRGFIPWDDDIDIWMFREDLMRLNDLPDEVFAEKGLELANPWHDPKHTNLAWRIDNGHTLMLDEAHMLQYHLCPFALGLDLFALDIVPRDPQVFREHSILCARVNTLMHRWDKGDMPEREKQKLYRQLEAAAGVFPDRDLPVRQRLMMISEHLLSMFDEKDGDRVGFLPETQKPGRHDDAYLPEWFGEPVLLPFEHLSVPAPRGYEQILAAEYGADYMTPKQGGGEHTYPFYQAQYARLKQLFEQEQMPLPPFLQD